MALLSRDEFDALEFGAARTGDHRDAALQMSQLVVACTQTAGMTRAEAHLRAGEQWLLADDPSAAVGCFRQALRDGGDSFVDAKVALARALLLLGDEDGARKMVDQLEADGRGDPRKCDLVAELLFEQSDLIGALDWANTGVELCLAVAGEAGAVVPRQLPSAVDQTELRMLLSLRYRIRNDMGLDEDEYDKLLDEL
ncbi:MAG TPA: tetratricopeptide repeat protein [Streptosporangiaceae bacterium]